MAKVANDKLDFHIKAEWHFLATSNGKNVSNGSGVTV